MYVLSAGRRQDAERWLTHRGWALQRREHSVVFMRDEAKSPNVLLSFRHLGGWKTRGRAGENQWVISLVNLLGANWKVIPYYAFLAVAGLWRWLIVKHKLSHALLFCRLYFCSDLKDGTFNQTRIWLFALYFLFFFSQPCIFKSLKTGNSLAKVVQQCLVALLVVFVYLYIFLTLRSHIEQEFTLAMFSNNKMCF